MDAHVKKAPAGLRIRRSLLVAGLVLALGQPLMVRAQQTVYWRSETGTGLWWYDTAPRPWWYASWGSEQARPDLTWRTANDIIFDNNNQTTHDLNGSDWYFVRTLTFASGASSARTFNRSGTAGIDMRGSGTRKIENNSTATHVFNVPISLVDGTTQFNPVNGNLTFNTDIYLGNNWIEVWGANQRTINFNGVLNANSGNGGLAVKQDSIVVLTNNNTFAGSIWVEKGTVRLDNHTNALGASGLVYVGTNATLELAYATTLSVRPAALSLYGTGTNAPWGALRKTTANPVTWMGVVTCYTDARIVATAGNIHFNDNIVIGAANTLYVTNVNAMNMSGGEMTGGKQIGDGAFHKTGAGAFQLRPGAGLTGTIYLAQGEIRQTSANASNLPAGGLLIMSGGTTYSSDGTGARTISKNTRIDGNVAFSSSASYLGHLTFAGNMDLNGAMRILTNNFTNTISGVVSNGGLTKAGTGILNLTGANTYELGTLVSAGVLQIGNNGTSGSVIGNITNNAALAFFRTDAHTYSGVISGTGTLTNRAGTLTLSGHSTYSGGTTVAGGTLLVSGSISNSAVTVSSGATLAGAGAVGSIASLAGTVSPGNTAGAAATLRVVGAAALGGGAYTCDITGLASSDCDRITAGGSVAAASTLTINLPTTAPTGFDECTPYSWIVMSGSSVSAANMTVGTKWTASGSFSVTASGTNILVNYAAPIPAAPTGLAASDGTSSNHVALSWNDVTCETGYVIWRHTANVFGSAQPIFTNAANVTTYNDTSAVVGTLYYYWVTATNLSGSSAASASDSGYRRLPPPGNVVASDGTSTAHVTITWDPVSGATSYKVFRSANEVETHTGETDLGTQTSPFNDTGATPGQKYWYWVKAVDDSPAHESDYSLSNDGYRKLATVTNVAATENLSDRVTVTWSDITGETGYNIWRHTADNSAGAGIVGTAAVNTTTYHDFTAVAGTPYYYWVRGTNSTSASMSDFSASDLGLRTLTEPTTPASNITFTALGPNSYTVGWARGDGDYVLVVARQGSAPADPTDSTVYTANAEFGLGDQTAAGSYVVYKGTGTSVPVTGLASETEYYFAVYEFNGADLPNYRTHDEPVSNRFTLATEPSTQASGITISSVAEVSLAGFNWTDGNGAGRLLVAKAGSPVDAFPADGSSYSYSTNFGSGSHLGSGNYVVWIGTGVPARISALSRDVIYHFRLFEYNGSGSTLNYNTNAAAGNPTNQTTMASNPTSAASNLTITAIGTNSFTITWSKGGAGTNTLIVVRAGATPSGPTDLMTYAASSVFGAGSDLGSGSYVVFTNSGTNVTVTGLAPATRYYVSAYAYNGRDGSQNYRTTDPPTTNRWTLMPEPTVQATGISFSTLADTSYAVAYTAGNGLNRIVVAKEGSAVDWFPADGVAYTGENNNFTVAADLGGGNRLVHRGASPFTLSGLSAQTEYHLRIYEYQGTNDTLNYNTNAASGNPASRHTLSTEPSAHAATFTATALSDTQIRLTWGAAAGESGFLILRKVGSAPTGAPADGTAYSQGDTLGDGTVVFVNTAAGANSTTDSYSTAASTAYHYLLFPYAYNGTPAHGTHNYRTAATVPGANATTGPAEPANSSSVVSFQPASSTSATIIWTNTGAADGTLILVRSNAAVSASPSDWTNYTANTTFGAGQEIGSGNYVVYAAAGSHGTVTVSGLTAGYTFHIAVFPYNGTGSFLNYRTTAPGTASLLLLPMPTAQTATADGKTLIDLAWTKPAAYDVMIVYKSGSDSTPPTQGTAYSVGDSVGGGTVIYKGSGATLEHVVASGTAHFYAFYSYSAGNAYSAGATASTATTAFAAGEIVETFSYTNNTTLTGRNGETGWGGGWYGDTGSYTNHDGSFAAQTNYPTPSGNKAFVHPPDNESRTVFRPLPQTYSSGRLYFGYILNYQWDGPNKWAGLSFYWTNATEKLFFGEIFGADKQLGIDNTASSYTLENGVGNDYIIVGYYDWSAGEAKVKAYKIGTQPVPLDEPTSWDLTLSKASNTVGWINSVRLGAGATSGRPGNVYFDELRLATNWNDLLGVVPSKPDNPTDQAATADGKEMIRLSWNKNGAGHNVMIVHKTSPITTDPTDGVNYNTGDTLDGGRVIYKGDDTRLEHVVEPGSTNYYKFYSYSSANYYSAGVTADASVDSYAAYERVNPFSYTNNTAFGTSMRGGQGFGNNYWVANSGTWKAQTNYATATADTPKFVNMTGYPTMAGNLGWVDNPGNGASATADRDLAATISTGNFYIAFMMAYQYYGANKWAGLSLMNGSTEKAFFGKGSGANWHTLAARGDGTTYWSAFDLLPYAGTGGNTGNVYLIVGHYNFETKLLRTKAWKILGNEFPDTEPTSWDASGTLGTGIDAINRIRLNVGSSDGGATIGRVFFDEIRYGTEWSHLLAVTCPQWAGSNTLNNAPWTAPASSWLGDYESFVFQSWPVSVGQSGGIQFDWAQNGTFATYHDLPWLKNANNNSYWSNTLQMVSAGVITSRFVASGTSCSTVYSVNPALTVQNLNPPANVTAARDSVFTNSQINLTWSRGVSGVAKDTLIIRQTVNSDWSTPVNGTTYNAGDSLGNGTVVYRGAATTFSDTGLAPNTTYYYRFYAENWTYYSVSFAATNAATAPGGQNIVIDGNPADWLGTPATVVNSAAGALQEHIWTDKRGDARTDHADYPNADITEFRVFADDTWVYFLVRLTNITDIAKPFLSIGVDTRTNPASTAMNWLGDDGNTYIGDGYFEGGAAHFPEYQINVHRVNGTNRIELYAHNGSSWYAPPSGHSTNVVIHAANKVVELKVPRADLNLTGSTVGRFTVASFLNAGIWNNEGAGTVNINPGTPRAVDSISIPYWNLTDNTLARSAWEEDISDNDIDFWFDVRFGPSGIVDNQRPATPVLVSPTNNAATSASPTLRWNAATDADGKVTGYLLEVSTNEQFNGIIGTENGPVDLRVNLNVNTTNYTFTTSATQYWWRVRARDTAGQLSTATTRVFRVVGKLDTEGPQPTLLYIGTNVSGFLAGDYDDHVSRYGYIQNVWDSEIRDSSNVFGFVLRWDDATGVYATNKTHSGAPGGAGQFAYNIVSTDGRVSPNWDLVEINTETQTTNDLWGVDRPFHATNTIAANNSSESLTNFVHAAFTVTNFNPAIEYYLTVSAEDAYTEGGSWWTYGSWNSFGAPNAPYWSGYAADGPNTERNVTTNYFLRINVLDDDAIPPVASTALGWSNSASLMISNETAALSQISGSGQDILYQATDAALLGSPLSFSFNAYDSYFKGVAIGTTPTFTLSGRTLTNTSFVVANWQTNWANFNPARSVTTDTRLATTLLTWHWSALTTSDVTALWGNENLSGEYSITNLIQLDLFDLDNDRDGDQASQRLTFGRLRLVDDDADDPVIAPDSLSVTGTGLASEYRLANLVEWLFTGSGGERLVSTNAIVATNIVSGNFTNDTGAITGTDVVTMSAGFSGGATRSWIFTLAPLNTNHTFRAESISFDSRVSSVNGPDRIEIFGTMPGGSETLWATVDIDLSDLENPAGTNWTAYSTELAMPAASTGTVTFRLKAYVADTNHLTATNVTATWSVDNLLVSGYILGPAGGTQVTDRDLARGTTRFSASLMDTNSGLYAATNTGRAPRVDFWHATGVPVTNAFFTNGLSSNGAARTATTVWGFAPPADKQKIQGGRVPTNYTARFWAEDFDTDRDGDSRITTQTLAAVQVWDNDTNAPVRGYKYGGPLGVFVDNAITKAVSSGFNREYRINDEQLQNAAATSLTVKVNLYDFSGWTVPTLTFSNSVAGLMSTNPWLTSLHTDTVNTTNLPEAEMVWTLAKSQAEFFFNNYESITNEFRVSSVSDKDDDRQDGGGNNIDNLTTNYRIGFLTFIDNDVGLPNVQSNWSVSRNTWTIPKVYWGLPGDPAASNLLINGDVVLANTNAGAVLASLTNRVYDSQLAKASTAAPLSVVLPIFDTGGGGVGRTIKGVQRGTNLTEVSPNSGHTITNTSLTIGTVAVQNTANFRSNMSSSLALTKIAAQFPTSTWAFSSFPYATVGQWLPPDATLSNYVMSALLYDADDNRSGDQRSRSVSLGRLLVVDNDTVAPSVPTNLKVNGQVMTGALDRFTAAWTNQPHFRISFTPSVDGDPVGTDLEKTGIGEYRTATSLSGVGPDLGVPFAVPSEGALANYGFEMGSWGWTLTGAQISTDVAYEGSNSLKMISSSTRQTVRLFNTNNYVPRVTLQAAQFFGSAATGTVTVAGLAANASTVTSYTVQIPGSAGLWVAGASNATEWSTTVEYVQVTLSSPSNTYWDDIRLNIELLEGGSPRPEVSAIFTATVQGLTTNYLFAVDRDNNRPGDRKASSLPGDDFIPSFGIAYDITKPTKVPGFTASTETVDDPTTQFDLEWSADNVGPDDPDDANHPGGPSRDLFSPWRTYKIYYSPFDSQEVPPADPGWGNPNAFIYTNFITTGAYTNWPAVVSTNAIADPLGGSTNYLALTNAGQGRIRLYDLDYDQEYALVIVGVDRAGNEGLAGVQSWATNNTIRFAITQGVMVGRSAVVAAFTNHNLQPQDRGAAGLFWIATGPTNPGGQQVTRDYDLIYWDSTYFNESSNIIWTKVDTVRSNWFADASALTNVSATLRFYRAAYKDRWRRTNVVTGVKQRPLASEEVYALHNVLISEGYNYVGLHGEPYTNTFRGVFGTDTNFWPAHNIPSEATRIEFYQPGTNTVITESYFLGLSNNVPFWYRESGGLSNVTDVVQPSNFFLRGFSITLPTNLAARGYATTNGWDNFRPGVPVPAMIWRPVLRVPTTNGPGPNGGFSHVIQTGYRQGRTNVVTVFNMVSVNLPVALHPSQMRLVECGFSANNDKAIADELYVMNTRTKDARFGHTVYCDANGTWRRWDNDQPAWYYFIIPNDIVIIKSRNRGPGGSTTWTWTYHPTNFYNLPTRWMGE